MRGPASSPRLSTEGRSSWRQPDPRILGSPTPSVRSTSNGGTGVGTGIAGGTGSNVPGTPGRGVGGGAAALPSILQEDLQDGYLSELLSYSLDRLNKEPELLTADAERVQRQMESVAVGHYRAFINASEAAHTIRHEIAAVDQHLGTMIAEIPKLTAGCNSFLDEAHTVLEKRRTNRTMLACHPALLDLLEIPQLMDTCVRNGSYDEALDLEAFMSKLCTMHTRLPVIQRLGEEVRQVTQSMLNQLLQRLRSNIQLPECLRIIGYLRRLGVFSKQGLRLQFLKCREAWLAEVLSELDTSSPYEYMKRMTDRHRVQLFDVVTQYRAIFADDSSGVQEEAGGAAIDGGLLYNWAMHRVSIYLRVLGEEVPKINDGGSLASVLDHCMYCGESLGRVGLDIRGLLPPLFEACIGNMFARNVRAAVQNFQAALDVHRWVPLPSLGSGSSRFGGFGEGSADDVAPPYSLMEHPPLAAFVNGILAALNELRHCAPLSLRGRLGAEVQSALGSVASVLLRYHQTRIVRESETLLFIAMCRSFVEIVCPYCSLCFNRCYGKSVTTSLDTRAASEPIRKLIAATLPPMPLPEDSPAKSAEGVNGEGEGGKGEQGGEGRGGEGGGGEAAEGGVRQEAQGANGVGGGGGGGEGAGDGGATAGNAAPTGSSRVTNGSLGPRAVPGAGAEPGRSPGVSSGALGASASRGVGLVVGPGAAPGAGRGVGFGEVRGVASASTTPVQSPAKPGSGAGARPGGAPGSFRTPPPRTGI